MPLIDMSEIFQMTNVGDHIDGTDVYQSNRNLLDNAYFVGGGSQLGDGVFPINQRGLSSYTGSTYTIDRWVIASSGITVTPNAGYIELSGTAGNNFSQVIAPEIAKSLYGKTVTVSALMYDGTILTGTGIFPTRPASSWNFVGFVYGTDAALIIGTSELYRSEFFIQTQSPSAKVCAVKLELGTVSTLANDAPPNYWLELQKCKARLRFVPLTRCPIVFASGNAYLDLNGCEMEGAPTAALYSNQGAVVGSSGASSAITSVTNIAVQHNVPLLQFNLASAINDQVGQIYNTVVQLSSEL